ncbi:MAG: hypothetical protein C4586_06310, partial [Anaerolineaceae bacterium]
AGPAGPAGPQGEPGPAAMAADLTCIQCHDEVGTISAKKAGWELEKHGNGTAMLEEYSNKNCAFCHSGNTFSAGIAAGQNFTQLEAGASEPARQDCRACHQIHTTYTDKDWALETTTPVAMVVSGATFDGGSGNLCVNCHQARRYMANFPAKDASGAAIADKYTPSIRFNTHLSDQSDIMLGVLDVNAVLGVEGKAAMHYSKVKDTCVGCHLGANRNHTFEAQVATCTECHADAKDLNINGYLTTFEEKFAALHDALVAKGMLTAEGVAVTKNADGSPVVLDPGPAAALFVYGAIEEDASDGIHNPSYVEALLDASLEALK